MSRKENTGAKCMKECIAFMSCLGRGNKVANDGIRIGKKICVPDLLLRTQ